MAGNAMAIINNVIVTVIAFMTRSLAMMIATALIARSALMIVAVVIFIARSLRMAAAGDFMALSTVVTIFTYSSLRKVAAVDIVLPFSIMPMY